MPREFNRSERVAGQIRRELAQIIQKEIRDPDIGFISLSDVEVTRDLAHAKVFITVFEAEKAHSTMKALQGKAKLLRHRLSQEMRLRSVPELHFHHDASVETGHKMDQLINAALAADHNLPDEEGSGGDNSEPE